MPLTRRREVAIAAAAVGWVAIALVLARIAWPAHAGLNPAPGALFALVAAWVAWVGSGLAARRAEQGS